MTTFGYICETNTKKKEKISRQVEGSNFSHLLVLKIEMFDCTDENKQKEAVPIFEKAAVQKCIFSGNSVEVFPILNQKNP